MNARTSQVERILNTSKSDWLGAELCLHRACSRTKSFWQTHCKHRTYTNAQKHVKHWQKNQMMPINNGNRCTNRQSLCRTQLWNMWVEPPNIPQLKDWHMQTNTCLPTEPTFQRSLNNHSKIANGWLKRTRTSFMQVRTKHCIKLNSSSPKACSKSQTNASQTNQQNQPQQTLNDPAINTQSALLRVEWVPWDSRTHDRKQRDKCHVPNMGKTWKTIVKSDGIWLWPETPATRSPKLMILDNNPEPSTLLWRTGAWITGFCKYAKVLNKMHRGMSNSHIHCATKLMVATAPRLCTPDVKQKPFSMKKKKTFDTRQHKRSIKAQSRHIYLTNDLILTNRLDPNCELQKPLYETTNWQTPYLLNARKKNGRRQKVSIQQAKQCAICTCRSTLDAQISHVERTHSTRPNEIDWVRNKTFIMCISESNPIDHYLTSPIWFSETMENHNVYNSTIFLPSSIVEHVIRIAEHLTIERLAHTFKHMPCHWTNQTALNTPSKSHMNGWLKRTGTTLM